MAQIVDKRSAISRGIKIENKGANPYNVKNKGKGTAKAITKITGDPDWDIGGDWNSDDFDLSPKN